MATRRERRTPFSRHRVITTPAFAVAVGVVLAAWPASADARRSPCAATAASLLAACRAAVTDDALVRKAVCINVSDPAARAQCLNDAKATRADDSDLCRGQRDTRLETCKLLGGDRYDPNLDPALFDDPRSPTHPNPYFPLTIGNHWEYRGGGEINTVDVVNETKFIAGITCIVFRDLVMKNGDLTESTNDYYTQAKDGTTWYFGEETAELESVDGDNPRKPEVVNIDGSFKTGRDGDKPGIIFLASPTPNAVYLEEFSLANAEDATVILSTTYAFGNDPELDQAVPQQLADRFCAGDCVVTKNFSLLEPGIFARKYYARGVGVILEVELDPEAGVTTSQLVDCNFDARCAGLPQP
jgi:hypothetical protein